MPAETLIIENIEVENAPDIPGLNFRGFRGEGDYPHMLDIINAAKQADANEWSTSVEDIARSYSHLDRSDPYKDILFAEVDGEAVGYGRCMWDKELDGDTLYSHFVHLKPDWRGLGIGKCMSDWLMAWMLEIAAGHPAKAPKYYQMWASDTEKWAQTLIERQGLEPVRYGLTMTRRCSEPIEPHPLPKGIEIRPTKAEHIRRIWDAQAEAFRDHWGFVEPSEENFKEWQEEPTFQPELWKVAWEGDEVVGMVLNFVNHEENKEYNRQRGYTENISVRRPWRRQGAARSLLTESIKMFQEMGMEETSLGVDTQNPLGAKRLYESVGYKEIKRFTTYRKLLEK